MKTELKMVYLDDDYGYQVTHMNGPNYGYGMSSPDYTREQIMRATRTGRYSYGRYSNYGPYGGQYGYSPMSNNYGYGDYGPYTGMYGNRMGRYSNYGQNGGQYGYSSMLNNYGYGDYGPNAGMYLSRSNYNRNRLSMPYNYSDLGPYGGHYQYNGRLSSPYGSNMN